MSHLSHLSHLSSRPVTFLRLRGACLLAGLAACCLTTSATLPAHAETSHGLYGRLADGTSGFDFDAAGDTALVVSSADLTGDNPDRSAEVFLWQRDLGMHQVTDHDSVHFTYEGALSGDGSRIALVASGNFLALGNDDGVGNELYVGTVADDGVGTSVSWQRALPGVDVSNGSVLVSGDGGLIFFASTADLTGENPDADFQIFRLAAGGAITQITHPDAGISCTVGSFPRAVSDGGSRMLFESRCRFGGGNSDRQRDIFLWDEVAGVRALTELSADLMFRADFDAAGEVAVLYSDGDLADEGASGVHVYRWTEADGFARLSPEAISETGDRTPLSFFRPTIDGDGSRILYTAVNAQGGVLPGNLDLEVFAWEADRITALTDSDGSLPGNGRRNPVLSGDGRRFLVESTQGIAEPGDTRRGLFYFEIASLEPRQPNLLVNGDFSDADELAGWTVDELTAFQHLDHGVDFSSGSMSSIHPAGPGVFEAASQCVPVEASAAYVAAAFHRTSSRVHPSAIQLLLAEYSTPDCSGTPLHVGTTGAHELRDPIWLPHASRTETAADAASLRVAVTIHSLDGSGISSYDTDAVYFGPELPPGGDPDPEPEADPIFNDGFESGDFGAWSSGG